MSRSIIIKKPGGPDVLELTDTKVGSPGPNEIKITNLAIGLNYIDTYHRSGLYSLPMPSGIGLEAAGKIDEVGANVKEFNKGDNVAYASMPIGAYAQQRIIPEKIAVKIPDGINHKVAASLMTKGLTTNYLLSKTYHLKAGETVLFHAAAGGVGQIFAQWANSIGANVIGTVGSDEKIKIAKEHGYKHVINYSKMKFEEEVMKLTNNVGVPAVFDGVGKKTLTRPTIGHYFTNREELQAGADEIFEKVKFGKIKIKIFKEYKLEDAKKAHEDLESRKILGPAILIP